MTLHLVFHKTCDRCGKPFDSRNLKYDEGLPQYEPQPLVLSRAGKQVFSFTDLCSKCEGVMENFIERIRLDEKPVLTDKSEKAADGAEKGKSEQAGNGDKKEDPPF
jgi:hypothetical protein